MMWSVVQSVCDSLAYCLFVATNAVDCLLSLVSEKTCYVLTL